MARLDVNQAAIDQIGLLPGVRDALQDIGEKVQTRAAQITAAEAVDTGLMAASWRVEMIPTPRRWVARVMNTAKAHGGTGGDRDFYAVYQEFGWRTRNGRHIPGKRILGRACDAARI